MKLFSLALAAGLILPQIVVSKTVHVQAQLDYQLATVAANNSLGKYYRDDLSDLLDCLDLTYHHKLRGLVSLYTSAIQHLVSAQQQHTADIQVCKEVRVRFY